MYSQSPDEIQFMIMLVPPENLKLGSPRCGPVTSSIGNTWELGRMQSVSPYLRPTES